MISRDKEEDSDSAPEDIAFTDAKHDALAHLKTVSEAAKEKKKLRKEKIKQRQERLTEQKAIKKQKLEELESKKLPDFVLDNLEEQSNEDKEKIIEKKIPKETKKSQNSRIVFDESLVPSDEDEDQADVAADDFIALETKQTDFKVVTNTDLKSSKFTSKDAFSFRERMLFGGKVKREPHQKKILKQEKLKQAGLTQKVTYKS